MFRIGALLATHAVLVSAAIQIASPASAAPTYASFDAPGSDTQPSGINNSNTITGTFSDASGVEHGFVRRANGKIVAFSPESSPVNGPPAINNRGAVAGSFVEHSTSYGFLRHSGGKTDVIDFLDGENDGDTTLTAIDDRGDVAGWEVSDGGLAGFVQAPDGSRTLYYHDDETWIRAINHSGTVAGEWTEYTGYHGFVGVHRHGKSEITTFDPAGSVSTYASSINDAGQVTGYYSDANSEYHGYVRTPGGKITSFDPEGSVNTYALGINTKGVIVGAFTDSNKVDHGFVRRPDGKITVFDVPCSLSTYAVSVSDAGVVTGY